MEKQTIQPKDSLQRYISEGTCDAIRKRYFGLANEANNADYGVLDRNLVVLDTETTGFSLNHDELIQIAAARMDRGKITEWFVTFVNPGHPIPEEIVHLTGIADEDVAGAPNPTEALGKLVEFVGDSDIVAHNAEFDRNFVTKNMYGTPLLQNTWIDSLDLARIALPRLKSHRLLDLVRAFDAPISTHRADADVEALCAVYRILLAAIDAMPRTLLQKIAEMAEESEWQTIKVFKVLAERAAENDVTGEGLHKGGNFSLRALRQERIKELSLEAKPDADAIAADPNKELTFPPAAEIAAAFEKEGLVGGLYDSYELRKEQVIMAEAIRQAFASSTNLAVEAGTGVGKSMAYLLPAALIAKRNNIAVGIATKTNALLDQLVYKELPLLAEAMKKENAEETFEFREHTTVKLATESAKAVVEEVVEIETEVMAGTESTKAEKPLDFVSLKGFTHYPCLRQINRIVSEGPKSKLIAGKLTPQAPSLAALLSYIEQSEYDDIDTLKIDYRALPRYSFTTTSNDCLRRKCPFFGTLCFVHGARRRAEAADIVVTNQSLLFCDLAADGGLLPPIRYWVIDEAHGAESEARSAFSLEVSAEEVLRLGKRVAADDVSQNAFIRAERRAGLAVESNTLLVSQIAKARKAGKEFEQAAIEFTRHIKTLSFFDTNKRSKGYEVVELWINDDVRGSSTFASLASFGRVFCDKAEKLITVGQEVVGVLEGLDEVAEAQREIASIVMGLKELHHAAEVILFTAPPQYAYAVTLSKKADRITEKLQALLVNVGEKLNETLFVNTHSVIFASATLAVAGSFESFENALGLNESEFSQTATCQLDSSYDFDSQMTVYVADDIPEPNDPAYLRALQSLLVQVHLAQQGSMLTLFTNRREMEKCFDVVQPELKANDLRLVCQKWGVSAKGLRDEFLVDEHLSLFALKSFWEGFDAPGATLKGVIIPKLPFAKPTDPLSCERSTRDAQAWAHYVLPAAVLETKQAAGRLIRGSEDEGCLILADRRLITKGYGKAFLKSLPSRTIKICSTAAIAQDLASRYQGSTSIQ